MDKGHNRNCCVLKDFVNYCEAHPDQRFWQALRNWSGFGYIFVSNEWDIYDGTTHDIHDVAKDTFNWEGRDK
jgi:hypothetical protein